PVPYLSVHIVGEPVNTVAFHPTDVAGGDFIVQLLDGIKVLVGKIVPYFTVGVKTADIDIITLVQLVEDVFRDPVVPPLLEIFVFKFIETNTGMGHNEHPHHENKDGHQGSTYKIRS